MNNKIIKKSVDSYFSEAISQYGATPQGVDWNGEQSQVLRFKQVSKAIDLDKNFSINDLGCGYGAYYSYLTERYQDFEYLGYDLCKQMLDSAQKRIGGNDQVRLCHSSLITTIADFSIASGIFNAKFGFERSDWEEYFHSTLENLNQYSRRGFSFNCLTAYSDPEKMQPDLYYPQPEKVFAYCRNHFSRDIALLHDYGLYDFTIIVRKE